MKHLLLACLMLVSAGAFAQSDEPTARASQHNIFGMGGFSRGFNVGFAYEYMYDQSTGVGGHLKFFPKEDDPPNTASGFMVVGGAVSHHFFKRSWDLSFSPSFNIINIDNVGNNADDDTVFGPGLTISLLVQLNDKVAIGFDNSRYWVWFDDDYHGVNIDDLSFKVRVSF